ncbi:docking domain of Afi1 for Arf3 in vesicle trafficking-domain-containing protein [Dactylonectria macrodidyma]|uniref:Docking domain of Afi1 for Arf3 in vesicle trafficking-domain-containing protein n=1 Tax=Dactylonectria macrodidyma TaxID=307937 RepID=A0A9P9FMV0_9HYPO|nr:docking domain of Afi1 for Arf3 in vesicle trafficking-domain-containing protein [Dactylonectria macrodidyma]
MASFQQPIPNISSRTSANNSTATNGITSNGSGSNPNVTIPKRRTSLASFPSSRSTSQMSQPSPPPSRSPFPPALDPDPVSDPSSKSKTPSSGLSSHHSSLLSAPRRVNVESRPGRKLRSQYPRTSTENHVEYILVASFDIDRGPVMEHQYPVAITGDENMLAELMLPDQAHARNQDWTIFFLHKDTSQEEEDEESAAKEERRRRRRRRRDRAAGILDEEDQENEDDLLEDEEWDDDDDDDDESTDSEPEGGEGPPLIYVLNLVNTKHDKTVKRGAIVKAMAICTRHPFLHIYKPLLLLALEEYFKSPVPETLAMLYDAVNAMDLSLMPKLSILERHLLQASDNKDLFVEKFEQMIQLRIAEDQTDDQNDQQLDIARSPPKPTGISRAGTKAHVEGGQSIYSVPRDTHEFESKVMYKGIPIPIKVPVAVMPETVGDFSLIKLIQNFSDVHAKSPQPFALHPHLTTNGSNTHPVIVLANALLTQKRVIFLGHNMPSGEVAEAVLAACALASGGILRGFTRHAFPYTDLTKVDDLLNVPGFIAGVTNPTFELHPEWWDVLCDLPSGRVKISTRIDAAPVTEGLVYFQQQNPAFANVASGTANNTQDLTGDNAFVADILRSIAARHGERVIRAKWRDWVSKFTRVAAQFEESVYGASALYIGGEDQDLLPAGVRGHGYVWPDDTAKHKELAGNVTRIEGWRNTRSYYSFIQDLAQVYTVRPLKGMDLAHMHDRLRMQRLSPLQSKDIYDTFAKHIRTYDEISLLLSVAPESHAGLFYIALGLFHKDREVRNSTADLLDRIAEHEAGQHWWKSLSRFEKLAYDRIRREAENERARQEGEVIVPVVENRIS